MEPMLEDDVEFGSSLVDNEREPKGAEVKMGLEECGDESRVPEHSLAQIALQREQKEEARRREK